jgi:hypothetical protein
MNQILFSIQSFTKNHTDPDMPDPNKYPEAPEPLLPVPERRHTTIPNPATPDKNPDVPVREVPDVPPGTPGAPRVVPDNPESPVPPAE